MFCPWHHLAVCNILYRETVGNEASSTTEDENSDCDSESEFTDNDIDNTSEQVHLNETVLPVIVKVRRVCRYFRKSPLKNEILQKYVTQEFGNELSLLIDVKTRWNSLLAMITRFVQLKNCLIKSSVDLSDFPASFTENDWNLLQSLISLLEPVKMGIEALGRQDATLLSAEGVNKFMLNQVRNGTVSGTLATALYHELEKYITERRNHELTNLLKYLTRPDCSHLPTDFAFESMPSRSKIENSIKKIWTRLFASDEEVELQISDNNDSDKNNSDNKGQTPQLHDVLSRSIMEATSSSTPICSTSLSLLRKEMNLFEATKKLPESLRLVKDALETVSPTTVEVERSFSTSGNFVSKIRNRLGDKTIDTLQFLKGYYSD